MTLRTIFISPTPANINTDTGILFLPLVFDHLFFFGTPAIIIVFVNRESIGTRNRKSSSSGGTEEREK
jgi:hypothetical protein